MILKLTNKVSRYPIRSPVVACTSKVSATTVYTSTTLYTHATVYEKHPTGGGSPGTQSPVRGPYVLFV